MPRNMESQLPMLYWLLYIVLVLFNFKNISSMTTVKLYEIFVVPIVLYARNAGVWERKTNVES